MKRCRKCLAEYTDETLNFCLEDGEWLVSDENRAEADTAIIGGVSAPGKTSAEQVTAVYSDGATASNAKRGKGVVIAAVIFGLAVVSGLGFAIYSYLGTKNVLINGAVPQLQSQRLTGDGKTVNAVISPNGKFLAYQRLENDKGSIWIRNIPTNSAVEILKPEGIVEIRNLLFAPDGDSLYFAGDAELPAIYRVPVLGGTPPVRVIANAQVFQFSPDGKQICFGRIDASRNEQYLFIVNVDGTNERKLITREIKKHFVSVPAWSPDGKSIAIIAGDDSLLPEPDKKLIAISVADGTENEIGSSRFAFLYELVWHPAGDMLLGVGTDRDINPPQLWQFSYPSGEVRQLTNSTNGYSGISITSDGKSIVTMEETVRSNIWVSPTTDADAAKPVMPATGDTWGVAWKPDGKLIYSSDQTGAFELWTMNADGSDAKAITTDRKYKATPEVSSDGRYIVYITPTENGMAIIRSGINGAQPTVLTDRYGGDDPHISPDDKWVIYSRLVNNRIQIARVPLLGGESETVVDQLANEPRYSPDGRTFACFLADDVKQQWNKLGIVGADGGEPLKVFEISPEVNLGAGPEWTPDGKGITYIVRRGETASLWVQPVDGGPPRQLTKFDQPYINRRVYSRDGKQIAIVRAESLSNAIMLTGLR